MMLLSLNAWKYTNIHRKNTRKWTIEIEWVYRIHGEDETLKIHYTKGQSKREKKKIKREWTSERERES